MRRDLKTHAIAIVSICLLVIVLYAWLAPKPSEMVAAENSGDRTISIYDATWGENCNAAIAAAKANPPPLSKDPASAPVKLSPVLPNNVLMVVGDACNGKVTCRVKATAESLGVEPLASCYKNLVVRHRCFSYDRAWLTTTKQGDTLTIDCNAPAPSPSKS